MLFAAAFAGRPLGAFEAGFWGAADFCCVASCLEPSDASEALAVAVDSGALASAALPLRGVAALPAVLPAALAGVLAEDLLAVLPAALGDSAAGAAADLGATASAVLPEISLEASADFLALAVVVLAVLPALRPAALAVAAAFAAVVLDEADSAWAALESEAPLESEESLAGFDSEDLDAALPEAVLPEAGLAAGLALLRVVVERLGLETSCDYASVAGCEAATGVSWSMVMKILLLRGAEPPRKFQPACHALTGMCRICSAAAPTRRAKAAAC